MRRYAIKDQTGAENKPALCCFAAAPWPQRRPSILCGSDGRQGALYHVCVAKEYRRRGIGTQMVGFCMHQLRYMGINKVSLIAFTRNEAGNAFWNQIGWTKKTNVNYYEFILNEDNITQFIGEENGNA